MKNLSKITINSILALTMIFPLTSFAQKKGSGEVTGKMIYNFTKSYLNNHKKDGYFQFYDPESNRTLYLGKATDIHGLSCPLGNNLYYNCATLDAKDGNSYDIDFFLRWNGDSLSNKTIILHKTNGKPRYVWDLEKPIGVWNALTVCGVDDNIKWMPGEKHTPENSIVYDKKTDTKPVYVWFQDKETGKWHALKVCYKIDKKVAKLYDANRKLK